MNSGAATRDRALTAKSEKKDFAIWFRRMKLCATASATSGTQPASTTSSARRAIIGSPGLIRPSDLCNQWGGPPYKSSPLCSAFTLISLRRYCTARVSKRSNTDAPRGRSRAVLILLARGAPHLRIGRAVIEFGLKHLRLGLRQRRLHFGAGVLITRRRGALQ